jgi:hypothetical protein
MPTHPAIANNNGLGRRHMFYFFSDRFYEDEVAALMFQQAPAPLKGDRIYLVAAHIIYVIAAIGEFRA